MRSLTAFGLLATVSAVQIPLPALPKKLLGLETDKKPLYFDRKGQFKIVTFSDMHYGESPEKDVNTTRVISTILDYERPSMVVYNGDLITGERQKDATGAEVAHLMDECFNATVQRKLPFASTYGNHDNSAYINHGELFTHEVETYGGKHGLSYTRSDVGPTPYGLVNYWLPIYASPSRWSRWWRSSKPSKPALLLWFLDSRGYVAGDGTTDETAPIPESPYWVDENSVPRYIKSQASLMRKTWGSLPPSLVFVHVPFKLAQDLQNITTAGMHDDTFKNLYGTGPVTQGTIEDTPDQYIGLDWATWAEIVRLSEYDGKVLAVTSGHDHGESWCARSVNSSSVTMCFDGHSGYGGYSTANGRYRNGRAFQLNLKDLSREYPSAITYNTYENSTRNDQVLLSQQYLAAYN